MKRFLFLYLFYLLLFLGTIVQAQQAYNQQGDFVKANSVWTFGPRAGLDFNAGGPVAISSSFVGLEGSASVADPQTGNLLFYSNGDTCWSRNGMAMPNGSGLLGNKGSTTQGVCIVPMIDSPGKYYLFSLFGPTNDQDEFPYGSLFYSIVDMNLDNGFGDIVSGQKNILLDKDTLNEAMIAVPGNNCDIWLIVHAYGFPLFKAYHITATGVDANPKISETGQQIFHISRDTAINISSYFLGGITVSPDRSRLALVSTAPLCMTGPIDSLSGVLLCRFDPQTGIVSDAIEIERNLMAYTCAFSPDNSKLYLGHFDEMTGLLSIRQYEIGSHNAATINASMVEIGSIIPISGLFGPILEFANLRLYRDTIFLLPHSDVSISTINSPNLKGTLCNYQYGSIPLLGGRRAGMTLPNEVVYPLPPDTLNRLLLDTLICDGWENGYELRPNFIAKDYAYRWHNGSPDTILSVIEGGQYWVSYNNGCHYRTDTFKIRGSNLAEPVINVNVFTLGTSTPYYSYQWFLNGNIISGATERYYAVTQNGVYRVVVANGNGCTDTSMAYEVSNYTSIEDPKLTTATLQVYPNPVTDRVIINSTDPVNATIHSSDGKLLGKWPDARQLNLKRFSRGLYLLKIYDDKGKRLKTEKIIKI